LNRFFSTGHIGHVGRSRSILRLQEDYDAKYFAFDDSSVFEN
jgi:hypothetical protein